MKRPVPSATRLLVSFLVPFSAWAANPPVPRVSVYGFRGAQLVRYDVAGAYTSRLGAVPFVPVHGAAWSDDASRWVVWGGREPDRGDGQYGTPFPRRVRSAALAIGAAGADAKVISMRTLAGDAQAATDVSFVRWDRTGRTFLVIGRIAPERAAVPTAQRLPRSVCVVMNTRAEVLHRCTVSGTIRSAAVSPDGGTWILVRLDGGIGSTLRWRPPDEPTPVAWNLPTCGASRQVVGVDEVEWCASDTNRLAVVYRLSPGDSARVIATIAKDGRGARVVARSPDEIGAVMWSPDGKRISWVAPVERKYTYEGRPLSIRYEVLWEASPGYEPRAAFDIVHHINPLRPEQLSALTEAAPVESYAWYRGGFVVLGRFADPSLLPMRGVWWVPPDGAAALLFEDPAWRGPVAVARD